MIVKQNVFLYKKFTLNVKFNFLAHYLNLELRNIKQTIWLLKQYKLAVSDKQKNKLIQKMRSLDMPADRLLQEFTPEQLITKFKKAIALYNYKPKNLHMALFATSKDLDYIGGEFSTFDRNLSQMAKNKEETHKIQERFKYGMTNNNLLSRQFSDYWISLLKKHCKLINVIRNTNPDYIMDAYNVLLHVLNYEFCKYYNCIIDTKIVSDWELSDIKPETNQDTYSALHGNGTVLHLNANIPEHERIRITEEFKKDPKNHPNGIKTSVVRINFSNCKKGNITPEQLFIKIMVDCAHEMQHALDYQYPNLGMLGCQIHHLDQQTYVLDINKKEYWKSATEISSYTIGKELLARLQKQRF